MKSLLFLVAFITGISCVSIYGQATGDYRSKQSGNWVVPANWERYDGSGWVTAVLIPDSTSGQINIRNGHTITVVDNANADQLFVDIGGVLELADVFIYFTVGNGAGTDMTINGTLVFKNAHLEGTGNVVVSATGILNYNDNYGKLQSASVTNNGTINWNNGEMYFITGITNNGNFNISSNNGVIFGNGQGIVNNGSITKSSNGLTQFINGEWTNNGTLNLSSGRLNLTSNTNSAGTYDFSGSAVFENTAFFESNNGTTITGTGSFINNNTISLIGNLTFPANVSFTSGVNTIVSGTGNLNLNQNFVFSHNNWATGILTVNGNIDFQEGVLTQRLTVGSGRTLTFSTANPKSFSGDSLINNGTIVWSDGSLNFGGTFVLRNNNQFNIVTDNAFGQLGNPNVVNFGTITKSGTGSLNFGVPFTNTATGILKGIGTIFLVVVET